MNWLSPRTREDRTGFYRLADNIVGIDDGVDTPGERLGNSLNALARGLYKNPVGTIANALRGAERDLNYLMFEGGAMQDPAKVLGYAAAPMAPGAMSGRAANVLSSGGAKPGITAYHGSPHSFDKFSMDAIGTGEGAQAYGHGLYFAENESVARGYRDALTGNHYGENRVLKVDGQDIAEPTSAQRAIARFGPDEAAGIFRRNLERAQNKLDALPQYSGGDDIEDFDLERMVVEAEVKSAQDALKEVESLRSADIGYKAPGSMYEVRINANPDEFLDWDQPMSKQPEKVRAALGNVAEESDWAEVMNKRGERVTERRTSDGQVATIRDMGGYFDVRVTPPDGNYYDASKRTLEDAKAFADKYQAADARNAASFFKGKEAELRAAGVPGVKYFDEQSRTGRNGEGTRNYVVFDDSLIEIVRKYGIAGAAAMLGVSANEVQAAMNGGQQQ